MTKRLVYLADDERDLRNLLSEILTELGMSVEAFPDGQGLLDRCLDQVPDLILLDINMPGASGWTVRERLLETAATAHVPVIAVTAQGGHTVEDSACFSLGFSALLRKPFRVDELMNAVESALVDAPPATPQDPAPIDDSAHAHGESLAGERLAPHATGTLPDDTSELEEALPNTEHPAHQTDPAHHRDPADATRPAQPASIQATAAKTDTAAPGIPSAPTIPSAPVAPVARAPYQPVRQSLPDPATLELLFHALDRQRDTPTTPARRADAPARRAVWTREHVRVTAFGANPVTPRRDPARDAARIKRALGLHPQAHRRRPRA